MRIILASKSPRRREILSGLGIDFEVVTKDTDESSDIVDPIMLVKELAYRKGMAVKDQIKDSDSLIISADTVVSVDNKILGKPTSEQDAAKMLKALSGKTHQVISGVTLIHNDRIITDYEITDVTFSDLSDNVIKNYISTLEPMDKAGAYAIQGLASMLIKGINGCYFNVVGFPVFKFAQMLKEIGINPYSITSLK